MRAAPELAISGLRKSYGNTEILHGVDLEVRPGEFVGLMGSNGAGKSTLLKILAGLTPRSAGEIRLGGELVQSLDGHRSVAFIHQDLGLVDPLSITENLRLGEAPMRLAGPLLNLRRERESATAALAAVSLDRSPGTLVGELSPAEKALVAIARALSRESSLLFVDEATSTLPPADALRVLASLRDVVAEGGTVVMVTHKLSEVLDTTERIVVMVDGEIARDESRRDLDRESLVRILVAEAEEEVVEEGDRKLGEEVLVLDEACAEGLGPVSLSVREGEILGLTGLPGSGLHDVAYLAAGAVRPSAGAVRITPGAKVGFVPPHRETQGGFPELAVRDNLTIAALKSWRNALGLLSVSAEAKAADEMVDRLAVHPPSADTLFDSLSGGNKQKVIFGRALFREPDVCVLCEPTRGVDAKTRKEIYALIRRLRDGGAAVLIVSSDAEDLFSLADHVGVVAGGRVANVSLTKEMAPENLEELV